MIAGRLVLLLILAWPTWASADCSGATFAALQTCLDAISGSGSGETITYSGGTRNETNSLVVSKYVRLVSSGGTITDNSAGGTSGGLIQVNESTAGSIRVEGFTITQGTGIWTSTGGTIIVYNTSGGYPVLITGNTLNILNSVNGNALYMTTNRGVIWDNTFNGSYHDAQCHAQTSALRHKWTAGSAVSWATASTFGSADTTGTGHVYYEHNTVNNFTQTPDLDDGARLVMRFNTFTNTGGGTHGVDTSGIYGGRYVEAYGNRWLWDQTFPTACGGDRPANQDSQYNVRGAGAIFHNNRMDDPVPLNEWGNKVAFKMTVEELQRRDGQFGCWGTDVIPTSPGSPYYPSPRNVGWGYTTGTGVNIIVPESECSPNTCAGGVNFWQDREPLLAWGGSGTGNHDTPLVTDYGGSDCTSPPSSSTFITNDADYFKADAVNCVAGGACTGGIGSGTSLPTTCTPTAAGRGPFFWKTNEGSWNSNTDANFYTGQGRLYECTASNTFTLVYTPYPYPHTLATASVSSGGTAAPRGRKRWHGPHAKPDRLETP